MKIVKAISAVLFTALFCSNGIAQKNIGLTAQQITYLQNAWYESPKELLGDTVTFRLNKYVKVTGTDSQAFEYSTLLFKNATDFSIEYWRWCPGGNYAYEGKWSPSKSGNILLDFGTDKCKCDLQIITVTKDELKVIIKEKIN